jgi:hypothetical protein
MEAACKQTQDIQNKIIKTLEAAPEVFKCFRPWTPFEDSIVRDYYYRRDINLIAKMLKRTVQAIESRANALGITRRKK